MSPCLALSHSKAAQGNKAGSDLSHLSALSLPSPAFFHEPEAPWLGHVVFVYYNLHKRCFSVRAAQGPSKGRVVLHARQVWLSQAIFKVSESGRQRVLRERAKNVHAGVSGVLSGYEGLCEASALTTELAGAASQVGAMTQGLTPPAPPEAGGPGTPWTAVTYDPYRFSTFVTKADEQPVRAAQCVWLRDKQGWAAGLTRL